MRSDPAHAARLTNDQKAEIEKMLEDAISEYREHLDPDAIAHVQADFSQLLDEWGRGPDDELEPCGEPPSAP